MTEHQKNPARKRQAIIGGFLLLAFAVLWIIFNFLASLFVVLFCAALAFSVDARLPLVTALVLLVICPFLLIMQQDGTAKVLAELSYYLLAIGVVRLFVDHVKLAWKTRGNLEELPGPDDEA